MADRIERREIIRLVNVKEAETVQESELLSKAKQRSSETAQEPIDGYASSQRGQKRFFLAFEKKARELELTGKKLEDDQVKMELQKVMESGVIPLLDVLKVYRKSVKVLTGVLKISEDEADRYTREMILQSVEMALVNAQSKRFA